MIKLVNYDELNDDFFAGRDFGSSLDVVKDILIDVKARGDEALQNMAQNLT